MIWVENDLLFEPSSQSGRNRKFIKNILNMNQARWKRSRPLWDENTDSEIFSTHIVRLTARLLIIRQYIVPIT